MGTTKSKIVSYDDNFVAPPNPSYLGLNRKSFFMEFEKDVFNYNDIIRPIYTTDYNIKIIEAIGKRYLCVLDTTDYDLYIPEAYLNTFYNRKTHLDTRTEYELVV